MKKLLDIVSTEPANKQLNESITECGEVQMPQIPPVSLNVNMNAQGIDQIKELLKLVAGEEKSTSPVVTPTPMIAKAPMMTDLIKLTTDMPKEEYANEPDEEVADLDAVIASGDDLHRSKKQYAKAQDGDNPMAVEGIRAQLDRMYKEIKESKKAKSDFLDIDKKVDEAAFEKTGVRATDKKKGKIEKSERTQYFVKLEKDGQTKGVTAIADDGESMADVRDRVARDHKSQGWKVANIRAKED